MDAPSKNKDTNVAKQLFGKIKKRNIGRPLRIVNDGFSGYKIGINKVFYRRYKKDSIEHIHGAGLIENSNNRIIEGLNGTIKRRTKIIRGFYKFRHALTIMEGDEVYNNFIKLHQGRGIKRSKTLARKAGIKLNLGRNRWLSLIFFPNFNTYQDFMLTMASN